MINDLCEEIGGNSPVERMWKSITDKCFSGGRVSSDVTSHNIFQRSLNTMMMIVIQIQVAIQIQNVTSHNIFKSSLNTNSPGPATSGQVSSRLLKPLHNSKPWKTAVLGPTTQHTDIGSPGRGDNKSVLPSWWCVVYLSSPNHISSQSISTSLTTL